MNPYGNIAPGDIFSNLPTMGLLKEDFTPGIVITPACDLANRKSETITYLPVVSIKSWLCSSSFFPELVIHFHSLWNQLEELCKSPLSRQLPEIELIEIIEDELYNIKIEKLKPKKRQIYDKIIICLELIKNILDNNVLSQDFKKFKQALPKVIKQVFPKVVSNSFSSDIHFLPSEKFMSNEAYVLQDYSVALLRFPITVPFETLDVAKDINVINSISWKGFIEKCPNKSCYKSFKDVPMRGLRLNQEYLSDLLTRYIGLYVRIGSPDFDLITREDIVSKIEEEL